MVNQTFSSLGLSEPILRALAAVGYEHPTPIQAQAIPHLLEGGDLLGIAQTGTGKTAAFALPLLERLAQRGGKPAAGRPRALILAPTRELALQIRNEIVGFGSELRVSSTVIFGGVGPQPQIQALRQGVDVLVATPGRLLDLMGQGHVDLAGVGTLVLDEADRLLDMGFVRDVQRIVRKVPTSRQSLLFSATMPNEVATLAGEILHRPVRVEVTPKVVTVEKIEQRLIRAETEEKRVVLERLLRREQVSRAIVFTRTKHRANRVAKQLAAAGIEAEAIHGNKSQTARQKALENFKSGPTWVLVATDIAARGIDVPGISHVINFELPDEAESYVHRIGRTARAGAGGVAWSLYDNTESKRLRGIERLVGRISEEGEAAPESRPRGRRRRRSARAESRGG
ncbi:MAG: DEAD/DEAH box helicase [Pseudomonadota bacterium]